MYRGDNKQPILICDTRHRESTCRYETVIRYLMRGLFEYTKTVDVPLTFDK